MADKDQIKATAIRMDFSLYDLLLKAAKSEGRSVNQQMVYIIRQALQSRDATTP